jgi:hypothetical protein
MRSTSVKFLAANQKLSVVFEDHFIRNFCSSWHVSQAITDFRFFLYTKIRNTRHIQMAASQSI